VQTLLAGSVAEMRGTGSDNFSDQCGCQRLGIAATRTALGLEDPRAGFEGTLGEGLALLGREQEAHDYFIAQWNAAEQLVHLAIGSGFVDRVAAGLDGHGRVEVDASELARYVK
jgi:hypothetical protein